MGNLQVAIELNTKYLVQCQTTNVVLKMASFVGRSAEIKALLNKIQHHKLVVIRGFKGIGKSALGREVCKHIQQPFYWIDLRNITIADEMLQSLVRVFIQEAIVLDDQKSLLRAICENIVGKGHHLLIVFDNAEDLVKDNDCGLKSYFHFQT